VNPKPVGVILVTLLLLCVGPLAAQTEVGPAPQGPPAWPYAQDVPRIGPTSAALAGSDKPDIVRFLMANGALDSELSPDGSKVAFSSRLTGVPQLWVVDAEGGWPRQLTFGSGISFFAWTPDGASLLVARDTEGDEREGYTLLSLDGRRERRLLPQSVAFREFGGFSPDGAQLVYASTERNGRDFDIWVEQLDSAESRLAFKAQYGFYPRAWRPDSNSILVDEVRGEDANDVHLLDLASGKLQTLFAPAEASYYGSYAWLPDGSGFYLSTNHEREFANLAFYDMEKAQLRFLHDVPHDVEHVSLSADARYLAYTMNVDGYSELHLLERATGTAMATPELPPGVYRIDFARNSPHLMIRINSVNTPGDVLVWEPGTAQPQHPVRATLAGLDAADFIWPEVHHFKAQDGLRLQGLLYRPRTVEEGVAVPAVVNVHGGPTSQSRPMFDPQIQFLVANGVAVFDVNVRGSTGFGKRYARLDNREKRLDAVRDLVDAAEFLAADPGIDGERLAVMGGSYGGYMVNAVLGLYPEVYAAGASFVGVSDWVRALEQASPALQASDRVEYGDISEERWQAFYGEHSPINTVQNIRVPLFVEHGVNDPRDPVSESDQLVRLLRESGGEVTYLRFPDEGHSLRKQANRVAFNRALMQFFEEHLLGRVADDS